MFERILMVCSGNLCRSPMAEAWMRHRLGGAAREVRSAGLAARAGQPAAAHAIALLAERGIDLSGHRARRIEAQDVVASDLVLVMESRQKAHVEALSPAGHGRTYLLGHWQGSEILDPYGGSRELFEDAFARIEEAVDAWLERIR